MYTDNQRDVEEETEKLLNWDHSGRPRRKCNWYIVWLSCCNIVQLVILSVVLTTERSRCKDPSLAVWSPANDAVEYSTMHFEAALANQTEYMGFPDDEIDQRWVDLYDFGISTITPEETKYLRTPTLHIPGQDDKYLIELDVFHSLHCLNDLRKLLYPERFQMLERLMDKDGNIDRNNFAFRHWDHCVDALRQTLMCQADVAPISFHVNIPFNRGVFPRLATTHTCRNFNKITEWAKANAAPDFQYMINDTEVLQQIIDESGFDNSPEENMEGLWELFPGNKFFKHWREHPLEGKDEVKSV